MFFAQVLINRIITLNNSINLSTAFNCCTQFHKNSQSMLNMNIHTVMLKIIKLENGCMSEMPENRSQGFVHLFMTKLHLFSLAPK